MKNHGFRAGHLDDQVEVESAAARMKQRKVNLSKKPPATPIRSDLFTSFLTNDESEVSNALEFWDEIPKYFLTAKQQKNLLTNDGLAQTFEWKYIYRGKPCVVRIQPALIRQENGQDSFNRHFANKVGDLTATSRFRPCFFCEK